MTILMTLDPDDQSKVLITGVPQLRSTYRQQKIVEGPAGLMMVAQPEMYNFEPLTFQVSVPSGSYLVIGPGSESRRATSVAHHFLVKEARRHGVRDGAVDDARSVPRR